MTNTFSVIYLLTLITLLLGCDKNDNRTCRHIHLNTFPKNATISYEGNYHKSPVILRLNNLQNSTIVISKPGYKTKTIKITHFNKNTMSEKLCIGGFLDNTPKTKTKPVWQHIPYSISINLQPKIKNIKDLHATSFTSLKDTLHNLKALKEIRSISEEEYSKTKVDLIKSICFIPKQ